MSKDQNDKGLLERLGNSKLPAIQRDTQVPDDEGTQVVEQRGRSPQEVFSGQQDTNQDSNVPVVETPSAKTYIVDGRKYTAEELEASGLLDRVVATAGQFKVVQEKYTGLLEKQATTPAVAPQPEPKPVITAPQILNAMAPTVKFAVDSGFVEADAAEAYPNLVANLAYGQGRIQQLEEQVAHLINWCKGEKFRREQGAVENTLDKGIETVASLPQPIYESLKKPEVREAFKKYIVDEVNPTVDKLTVDSMKRYWLAFNAENVEKFFVKEAEKPKRKDNRQAAGEMRGGARSGNPAPDEPKSLLDQMTDFKLGVPN